MNEKRYNPIYENGKIIKVTGNYGDDMVCVEQMIDEMNDLNHTRDIWMKYAKKLEKLLYEKIKPTYSDVTILVLVDSVLQWDEQYGAWFDDEYRHNPCFSGQCFAIS